MGRSEPGICQRKGRPGWYVRVILNGQHKWHKCATKTEAKALQAKLKSKIWEGTYFPEKFTARNQMTVKAWLKRYLEGSTNLDKLHETYRCEYWMKVFGSRLLRDISISDLRRQQHVMQASGQWKPATINRRFSALRRPLTLAVQEGIIAHHPMKGIKFLPEPVKDRFFTDEELKKLKGLSSPQQWRYIVIAVGTCLRAGEQFGLRWEYVNFDNSVLSIPMSKSKKTRRVPLSEEVKDSLRVQFSDSPWVFPSPWEHLTHENPSCVGGRFKKTLRKGGIQGASWHTLRHTGASRLLRAGADIVTVSKILGHSTVTTTMRYVHLVKDQLHEAVNRVNLQGLETEISREEQFQGDPKVIQGSER